MRSRVIPLLALVGALCSTMPRPSLATVRYVVSPEVALGPPTSPYTTPETAAATITEALAVSVAGDSIEVAGRGGFPLEYSERFTLKAGVALLGGYDLGGIPFATRDPDSLVSGIKGGFAGTVIEVETGADRTTLLDGFLIRDGLATNGGGLRANGASPTIRGNVFFLNQGTIGGGAIRLDNGSSPLIIGNSFIRNTSQASSGTVDVSNSSPEIVNNVFFQDLVGVAIRCNVTSTASIRFNDLFANVGGDSARGSCSVSPDSGNVSIDPLFCDVDAERFTLFAESRLLGAGEGGANIGATGPGCRATVKFVSSEGSSTYPYNNPDRAAERIQDALDIAGPGDTVRVAEGEYLERINVPAGIILEGSWNTIFTARRVFGAVSVLQSDSTGAGPLATFLADGGTAARFDGFVVTGGHAIEGSAIQITNASPVLRGLSILLNVSSNASGGAIHVNGGAPEIVNTLIAINRGAGVSCTGGASPNIHHSGFFDNSGGDLSGCPGGLPPTVLTEDPLFCDPADCAVEGDSLSCVYADGDFHLFAESRYTRGADDGGLIGALTSNCNSEFHYVSPSGGNVFPYTTEAGAAIDLQTAIDIASESDKVLVEAGTYVGMVVMAPGVQILGGWDAGFENRDPAANEVTLSGDVPGMATVLAQGFAVDASSVLDGFTITHQPGVDGPGIEIRDDASPQIMGNLVRGNTTAREGAGILIDEAAPEVRGNTVYQNQTTSSHFNRAGGLFIRQSDDFTALFVHQNIFYDNRGGYGIGCEILGNEQPQQSVSDNIVFANEGAGGPDPNMDLSGCFDTSGPSSRNDRVDPLFCDYPSGDITLCFYSPARGDECGSPDLRKGARGIGCIHCNGTTHKFYVRASNPGSEFPYGGGPCAAGSISDVAPFIQPGDTLLFGTGVYRDALPVLPNVTYMGNFNSEFSDRSSESNLNGESIRTLLYVPPGIDSTTVIDGFTFTNGAGDSGGAVFVSGGSSPIIRNIRYSFNRADSGGGAAIYCAPGSSPKIRFCFFTRNRIPVPVAPIVTLDGSAAELSNCTFFENLTIGIDIRSGSPSVFNNILMRNDRGGIRCGAGATPDLGQNDAYANDDFQYFGCPDSLLAFNISADPLFCSLQGNTLPLFDHSPCAGTGRGGLNMGAFPVACHTPQHFVSAGSVSPGSPFTCPDSASSSIQAALDLAGRNTVGTGLPDTVFIAGGVYNEDVTIPPNVIVVGGLPPDFGRSGLCTHSINSRNPELYPVVIRGTGNGPVATFPAGGSFENTIVEDVTFRAGNAPRGGGVFVDRGAGFFMRNCSVDSCAAAIEGGGVYLSPESSPRMWLFSANANQAPAGAAVFGDSAAGVADFQRCTFVENTAGPGGGIVQFRNYTGKFRNTITALNEGIGAVGTDNTVLNGESRDNLFWENSEGDTTGIQFPPSPRLVFDDPRFCNPDSGDYSIYYRSPARIGCGRSDLNFQEIMGRYPVGCTDPGHAFRVRAGNTGEYPFACTETAASTISAILPRVNSNADSTDTIKVSSGVIFDNMELRRQAVLLGGWSQDFNTRNPTANVTTVAPLDSTVVLLRIESAKDANGVVIPESVVDTTTVIDGFTFSGVRSGLDNGAAISCIDASPRITNNVFRKNTSQNLGGAIYTLRSKEQPIRNNSFFENRAAHGGAIYIVDCEDPVVSGNLIVANRADLRGAGIRLAHHIGAAAIDNNTIVNNKGEGVSFAGDDAASSSAGEKSQIYNNIFAFNTRVGLERYPVSAIDSLPVQDHNLHWGNRGGNFAATTAGAGDVFLDPLFCSLGTNDLRLQACSPAIGAGRDAADSVIGHLAYADTLLTCRDKAPPGVTISFLKNTVVPRFLDVYVAFTEVIVDSSLSVLRICENQPSVELSPNRVDSTMSVYGVTGLETSNCGVLTIDVRGRDRCDSMAHFSRQVSTVIVTKGVGARLKSPDGVVRVDVPDGHGARETLLLLATAADSRDGGEDAIDADVLESLGEPLGSSYELLGAGDLDGAAMTIRFRLPQEIAIEDAGAVALYHRLDTGWVRVESSLDAGERSLVAPVDGDGAYRLVLTGDRNASPRLPARLALYPNAPNPAPGRTTIAFDLPVRSDATLRVYDVTGRRIVTLVEKNLPGGRHAFEWNGTDGSGRRVPSGVYFYELRAAGGTETRKLVLVR